MKPIPFEEARDRLIIALQRDAGAQEAGHDRELGMDFHEIDGQLPRNEDGRFRPLLHALAFWDYWLDARNHEWTAFYGIERDEWPALARDIVTDLQTGRPISSARVLALIQ